MMLLRFQGLTGLVFMKTMMVSLLLVASACTQTGQGEASEGEGEASEGEGEASEGEGEGEPTFVLIDESEQACPIDNCFGRLLRFSSTEQTPSGPATRTFHALVPDSVGAGPAPLVVFQSRTFIRWRRGRSRRCWLH
jgi:hypothetical protein